MKSATDHPYVTRLKGVCGGDPVVKGTRVSVRIIAECWRSGMSPEEIREAYPHLGLAQVFDALSYAEDHAEEIEHLIREDKAAYQTGAGRQTRKARAVKV